MQPCLMILRGSSTRDDNINLPSSQQVHAVLLPNLRALPQDGAALLEGLHAHAVHDLHTISEV